MRISDLINQLYIKAEIADTPSKCEQGLMFRDNLHENEGMLFKFKTPQNLKFWGVNTYIPLDIAFLDENNKITKIGDIAPLKDKLICSEDDCIMALETNYNFFNKNKINVGDTIEINPISKNTSYITFKKLN